MAINFIVQLLIGVALAILGYMLMPKPPKEKPPQLKDFKAPEPRTGIPIPVPFGSVTITGLNILWYGNKERIGRPTRSDGSKWK